MKTLLSPKELAQAIGVSESSVKRWADEGQIQVSKTAGGHRRIAVVDAVRFVRATRLPVVRPEFLGMPEVALSPGAVAPSEDATRLLADLIEGRAAHVRGLLLRRFLAGESVAALADGPLRAALQVIGEVWHEREDGILIEHRALEICHDSLSALRMTLTPRPGAPVAVGGAGPDDPYRLASLLAALVLEERGLRAVNLGPRTPLLTLRQGIAAAEARLAWLSLSMIEGDAAPLRAGVEALADHLASVGGRLVVGGRALDALGLAQRPGLFAAGSLSELAAFVAGLDPQPS